MVANKPVSTAVQRILDQLTKKNRPPSSGPTTPGVHAPESQLTEMIPVQIWEPQIDLGGLQGFQQPDTPVPEPRRDTTTGLSQTPRERDRQEDTPRIPWTVPWPDDIPTPEDPERPYPDEPTVPTVIPPVERPDIPELDEPIIPTPPPPEDDFIEDRIPPNPDCEMAEQWVLEHTGLEIDFCRGGVSEVNIVGTVTGNNQKKKRTRRRG